MNSVESSWVLAIINPLQSHHIPLPILIGGVAEGDLVLQHVPVHSPEVLQV